MATVAMAGLASVRFPASSSCAPSPSSSLASASASAPSFSPGCASLHSYGSSFGAQHLTIRKECMLPVARAMIVQVLTTESPLEVKETAKEGDGADGDASSVGGLKLESEADILKKKQKRAELRRKRLVRKRHLRKKGRWPPSKMAKLKNV